MAARGRTERLGHRAAPARRRGLLRPSRTPGYARSRRALLGTTLLVVLALGGPLLVGLLDPPVETEQVAPSPTPVAAPSRAPDPVPVPAPAPQSSPVQAAVEAADATVTRRGADVGIAVLDRTTGALALNDEADDAMNSASLSKLLTAVDLLDRGAAGRVPVTAADRRLVRAALGPSDDPAMNALWTRFGGQSGITRVIERLGLEDTEVPADPSQWGEVQLSARDMTTVFRHVLETMAPADRDLVLGAMSAAPATASDGFDQAFGLLAPEQRGVAAKQGWLCCLQSSVDLHSAGVLDPEGRFVVAVLSNQPFGYAAARAVLDDAVGALREVLV
ncbi:serine hydrolase [Actinomycetospora soli]|uniref:serine hydrolase n=1 Tax=Actinomycetospora soli TaxID=2893887 RepID=UPI001E4B2D82|nr:serine hydrolase [Actinomycetospora soli]MCD2186370.1 class A beta-lactamase-related serine hydrolase [Actinomycetospora soli]